MVSGKMLRPLIWSLLQSAFLVDVFLKMMICSSSMVLARVIGDSTCVRLEQSMGSLQVACE